MPTSAEHEPVTADVPRAVFGGVLMGLANLVPGISGGTMLLAAGIYPKLIASIALLTTLRLRPQPIIIVATVAIAALLAIVLAAGLIGQLVVEHRWIMFSIFIGLTLGGVPVLYRMIRPLRPSSIVGIVAGLIIMLGILAVEATGVTGEHRSDGPGVIRLIVGGAAAGSAMILPGVSGSYLLLVLGLYLPILEAVDQLRDGLGGRDIETIRAAAQTIIPVGIGVALSIVAISHLLKALLARFERVTLGVLLGLLLGAVVGLWPFQSPVKPEFGEHVRGVPMISEEQIDDVPVRHWRVARFTPSPTQAMLAGLLAIAGFGIASAVDHFGARRAYLRQQGTMTS